MRTFRQALELARATTRAVALGGNLASLSLLRDPELFLSYCLETLFLRGALSAKRGLPQKNVFEVLNGNGETAVVLGGLKQPHHWFSAYPSYATDIVSLGLICQITRPRVVFEIGTLAGYTALHFALNTPADARVYTLDLPKRRFARGALGTTMMDDRQVERHTRVERYCFDDTAAAEKITCLVGDSATFDFSEYYRKVDFFFIDGAHSYDYVRSDTLNALECCRAGSVLAWHDFGRFGVNGVSKWLRELSRTRRIYSVPGGSVAFTVVD